MYRNLSGGKEGILLLVFNHNAFQVHPIEETDAYVPDTDPGLQLFGKPSGDLACQPVLTGIGLKKTPYQQEQEKDHQHHA
jgi:hypothetical protein